MRESFTLFCSDFLQFQFLQVASQTVRDSCSFASLIDYCRPPAFSSACPLARALSPATNSVKRVVKILLQAEGAKSRLPAVLCCVAPTLTLALVALVVTLVKFDAAHPIKGNHIGAETVEEPAIV